MGDATESQRPLTKSDSFTKAKGESLTLLVFLPVLNAPGNERKVSSPWRDRRDAKEQAASKSSRSSESEPQRVLNVRRWNVFAPAEKYRSQFGALRHYTVCSTFVGSR